MKRILMALFLFCSLLRPVPGSASGSTSVYLTVSKFNFSVAMKPILDLDNKKLYDLFESNNKPNAFVVSIAPRIFDEVHLYNCWGFDAVITFEDYGSIAFRYFPEYKATIGMTPNHDFIILQPRGLSGHSVSPSVCDSDETCENEIEDVSVSSFN